MENIIKKAIEGGWDKDNARVYDCDGHDSQHIDELMLMDKTFWQSLGKECGWGETTYKSKRKCEECHGWGYSVGEDGEEYDCYTCGNTGKQEIEKTVKTRYKPDWKASALKFHEINLTEGWDKAVEYLNGLIK